MKWSARLERKADLRARAGLSRTVVVRSSDLIDLAGNDYLGLSRHDQVVKAAAAALHDHGLGATGSRLVNGTTTIHHELEEQLGAANGGDALLYSSGYLANLGAVLALSHRGVLLLHDAHCHASLIDGCRLSGNQTVAFGHSAVDAVDDLLARHGRSAVVIVESVYSVEGDAAPLVDLHRVCRAHGAVLLVDEAHSMGVIGRAGLAASLGLTAEPDVVVTATLSKALAAAGGAVIGPPVLRRHLVDTGRTFIFDTASPPAVVAGALAAWEVAAGEPWRRATVLDRAGYAAQRLGVDRPAAGIVAVPVGSACDATAWAARCRAAGVAVGCFRPPSTPGQVSYLRLTVNAGLDEERFRHAVAVVARERA